MKKKLYIQVFTIQVSFIKENLYKFSPYKFANKFSIQRVQKSALAHSSWWYFVSPRSRYARVSKQRKHPRNNALQIAALFPIGGPMQGLLQHLATILQPLCTEGFRAALNWAPMMPRDASLSGACTSGLCRNFIWAKSG